MKDTLKRIILVVRTIAFVSTFFVGLTTAFGNENAVVMLDLNSATGNQGVTIGGAAGGEEVVVEVYATVTDVKSFTIRLGFDHAKLSFVAESSRVESGFQIMPPALMGEDAGAVGMLFAGSKSGDPLLLATMVFRPVEGFEEALLTVAYAEFKDASGVTDKPAQDATATITEGPVGNHLPVFTGPLEDQEVEAWDGLTFHVAASDADGDSLMCAAERLPLGAVFDESTWTFVWRPVEEQVREEPYLAVFSISDGDTTVAAVVRVYVRAPSELRLFEGPEILGTTDHEAVVWWRTNMPSDTWLDYGLNSGYGLTKGSSNPVMIHRVLLTALWPDTTYYYRVRSVSAADTVWGTGTFRTQADTSAPAV
ncbi:MAG: fibronectin type III domain-containing protein, partial [Candidatus Latescibacteria bacterium]|nr:fibronectin type III domain-containing protein [Candidatus Latescibacterota bacterium]